MLISTVSDSQLVVDLSLTEQSNRIAPPLRHSNLIGHGNR